MLGTIAEVPRQPATGGRTPLAPRRDMRLIVCLSTEERARLAELARAAGHESLASFVRARSLAPQGTATSH